jgi:hypothetical protein
MDGIIQKSTKRHRKFRDDGLEGYDIHGLMSRSDSRKVVGTLFRAVTTNSLQWCDYAIRGRTYVALIEYSTAKEMFIIHEVPHDPEHIHDTKRRLMAYVKK